MAPGPNYERSYSEKDERSDNDNWDKRFQEDKPLCKHIQE